MQINCNGLLIDFKSPKIMGILNTTPDSFYDGGKHINLDAALQKVDEMLNNGADFIDVGGYSTRPNANNVTESEEIQRTLPIIEAIVKEFPEALISIDTFRANVAKNCVEAGACIINDISGGSLDENMFKTVAQLQVPYVLMHSRGNPKTMVDLTDYNDVVVDINYFFSQKIEQLKSLGVNDIILDVGFGFAKDLNQNYKLMQQLNLFGFSEFPLLVGVSRKSMVYKLLNTTPNNALNGTTVLHTLALEKGAKILRVHDVKEAKETIKIWEQVNQN